MIALVDPTYVARVYDYSQFYRPSIKYAAEYYAEKLAPLGVQVEYLPMPPLGKDACYATTTPKIGIRVCDDTCAGGTAGSTGMDWVAVAPNRWELRSYCYFHYPLTTLDFGSGTPGMAGRFLAVHEFGHSFGNLPHTADPNNPSAMSALGAYKWDFLTPAEIQKLADALPRAVCPTQPMGLLATTATTPFPDAADDACRLESALPKKRGKR
jgi:hypothetical protein